MPVPRTDIEKPYFPCLIGNGIDAVLLDYSGSMCCDSGHVHMEQHQGVICAWYKATHRGIHKSLPPLLQSTYTLMASGGTTWYETGGETFDVASYEQRFDAERGVLLTTVQASDFHLEVTTFLTADHVLVEHYRVLAAPTAAAIGLNLTPPGVHWSNGLYSLRSEQRHAFRADPGAGVVHCNLEVGGIRGRAIMYVDRPASTEAGYRGGKRLVLGDGIAAGTEFTRYVIVVDDRDRVDYRLEPERILDSLRRDGYQQVRQRHEDEARQYASRSRVAIPDPWLAHVYSTCLYNIRAHQNPYTGLISLGNYPQLWGGGICDAMDVFFPHKALLSANRLSQAEEAVAGYLRMLPLAGHYARQLGHRGAFLPWFMTYEGEATDFSHPLDVPNLQKSNNGAAVMQAWDLYQYTGDRAMLERHWPVIREVTAFLVSNLVVWHGDEARVRQSTGADEVVDRANDSLTLITILKAVEGLLGAADVLGIAMDPVYRDLPASLRRGLARNYVDGVLMPWLGATGISSVLLYSYLLNLPEGLPAAGVERALVDCQGEWGLTNPHNYRNLVWPWADAQAAAVLAHMGDGRAHEHLCQAARVTSELGAMPEKVRPDRFWIGFYYTTCCGAFAWALNSMLAHSRGDTLSVLAAAPRQWTDLEFENLRVQPGLLVSAQARGGRLTRLTIANDSPRAVTTALHVPEPWRAGVALPPTLTVAPGAAWHMPDARS